MGLEAIELKAEPESVRSWIPATQAQGKEESGLIRLVDSDPGDQRAL